MATESHKKDKQHAFDSYSKKLLKNVKSDYYRSMKRKQEREISLEDLTNEQLLELSFIENLYSSSDNFSMVDNDIVVSNEILGEALQELSPSQRKILMLSYCLEMTDAEIAELTNIVRRTVSYRRNKILKKLKGIMEALNEEK